MSELTPTRLSELRRIAEQATPGPWEWRMSKDGRILALITLESGYSEEIITTSHLNAWLQVRGGLKDFIPAFDPTTVLELLDALAAARAVVEAARRLVNNAKHGVDPVDVYELREAIKRYDERCGGGSQ